MTSCWYGMIFHTDLYRPYQTVHIGPPGYRYVYHPLLGGTAKIDRRRSIEGEKGKKKKKRKKRKKKKKKKKRRRILRAILARTLSSPTSRRCSHAVAACGSPIFPIFPHLVNLPIENFQGALSRMLQVFLFHFISIVSYVGSPKTGPCLTPAEVLIAIHGIDPVKDGMPLKKVIDACSACFEQRKVFTQPVLAKVLNQLVCIT
ncbi:hypothetical protein GW17_00016811 [Ensete ventricosum]|nr:hypothetical protein GW17_00016811 [Ensete ventricosum]